MKQLKVLFVYPSVPLPHNRLKTYHTWLQLANEIKVIHAYNANYKMSFINRILNRLKLPRDTCKLNERLRNSYISFKPDLVFIVKGVLVKPSTLKYIKQFGAKLVSWSNDDMYAWHNRSLWYTWALKYYDLVVTQKSYNCNPDELPSLGAKVMFQDKAIDPAINRPVSNCRDYNCVHDVVFIGTKEQDRLEHLQYLAENGVVVHIYGWAVEERGTQHPNLIFHHTHLYGDDYNAAFGCSKIVLNFLRKMNRDLQTSRSIEIPAAGGFMLAERTNEHRRLFEEGKEAEFFGSKEELLEKVRYYLQHEAERKAIAQAGYRRVLESDYTFKNRMTEILKTLELV
jgi:spore maturation protein CgeB